MAHNIDWDRFDYPWCVLGPRMQLKIRKDVKAIIDGEITKQEREGKVIRRQYKKANQD